MASGAQKILRLRADALDERGAGVGAAPVRGRDRRLHVPGLLPGEEAEVRLQHLSPHSVDGWATLVRRLNAAEDRVVPPCPAYGRCGGCALQHLAYGAQVRWKAGRLGEALQEAGAQGAAVPCHPSDNAGIGQRTRAKLVAAAVGGRVVLGAYAPRTHEVVDTCGCRVVTPALRAAARATATAATGAGLSCFDGRGGQLRYVLLRELTEGIQLGLVFAEPPGEAALGTLVGALREAVPGLASVTLHENREPGDTLLAANEERDRQVLGPAALWERLALPAGALELRVSPRSFFQVNRGVAARLYADVVDGLGARPGDRLLDLYCGVGGIGLAAARAEPGLTVLGVEEGASAVADAEAAAARAGLGDRCRFLRADARALGAVAWGGAPPTLCALNPPRRGCDPPVLEEVAALAPRRIAYVSCDPESLGRDLGLLAARGYAVTRAAAYDMHPHTPHVEALALLERPS